METEIEKRYIDLELIIENPDIDFEIIDKADGSEPERTMVAVISTPDVDRVGDRVLFGAFKNLSKTPVPLLWQHDRSLLPLGGSQWFKYDHKDKKLRGKFLFASTPRSNEAYELVKEGFIKTVSVGFNVLGRDGIAQNEYGGYDIKSAELLEVSLVNIPANRGAVIEGIKALQEKGFQFSEGTLKEFEIECDDCIDIFIPTIKDLENDLDVKWLTKEEIEKPYPNEHACRLNDPDKYTSFARKKCAQKSDNKCIDVIYGIAQGKSEIQALRYPKDIWTADAAKAHCASREGSFEAAGKSKTDIIIEIIDTCDELTELSLIEMAFLTNHRAKFIELLTKSSSEKSIVEESGDHAATSESQDIVEVSGDAAATSDLDDEEIEIEIEE